MTNSDRLRQLERQNKVLWDIVDINNEFKGVLISDLERIAVRLDSILTRLDKLEGVVANKPKTKKDAKVLVLALHDEGMSSRVIAKHLHESGYTITDRTVRRWVEENCND